MDEAPARSTALSQSAWIFASGAPLLGALYAAVSAYWGAGGTALLDTVGGTLAREGRARTAGVLAVVWATVAVKLAASGIGLVAVVGPEWLTPRRYRVARVTAWLTAAVLVLYGGVLTSVGVLVQVGVISASAHADHRALEWHAFLWDPWFLLWGLLLGVALRSTRRRSS